MASSGFMYLPYVGYDLNLAQRHARIACEAPPPPPPLRGERHSRRAQKQKRKQASAVWRGNLRPSDSDEIVCARTPFRFANRALNEVEQALSYQFRQRSLLRSALVHSSVSNERRVCTSDDPRDEPTKTNNERLEFLGDAVLYLGLAEALYKLEPEVSEGEMTIIRSKLLTGEACASYIRELDLDRFLVLGKFVRRADLRNSTAVMGDFFEALLGAVYLDGGLSAVYRLLEDKILSRIPDLESLAGEVEDGQARKNYRNQLQSVLQQRSGGLLPTFEQEKIEGPDHDRRYTYSVLFDGEKLGWGEGASKKQAVNRACRMALEHVGIHPGEEEEEGEDPGDEDGALSLGEPASSHKEVGEDSRLASVFFPELREEDLLHGWPKVDFKARAARITNEIYGCEPEFVELERVENYKREDGEDRYICALSVEGSMLAIGSGRTKKEAEQRACRRLVPLTNATKSIRESEAIDDHSTRALLQALMEVEEGNKEGTPEEEEDEAYEREEEEDEAYEREEEEDVGVEREEEEDAGSEREEGEDAAREQNEEEAKVLEAAESEEMEPPTPERFRLGTEFSIVTQQLDVLFSRGILFAPLPSLVSGERVHALPLLRSVERVAKVSGRAAAILARHYASLLCFFELEMGSPKLSQEVYLEVLLRKTVFVWVEVKGSLELASLPRGRAGWKVTGTSTFGIPHGRQAAFYLVRLVTDGDLDSEVPPSVEYLLVPNTNNVEFESDENKRGAERIRMNECVLPAGFLLQRRTVDPRTPRDALEETDHPDEVEQTEDRPTDVSDRESAVVPDLTRERYDMWFRTLLSVAICGNARMAQRLLNAENIDAHSVQLEEARTLLQTTLASIDARSNAAEAAQLAELSRQTLDQSRQAEDAIYAELEKQDPGDLSSRLQQVADRLNTDRRTFHEYSSHYR